jgi:hypothetical protein
LPVRELSEAAPLLTLLRRIRRRLRLWMAVEGAVVGAAVGAIGVGVAVAAANAAGHVVGLARPVALVVLGVAVGALVRASRRVALAACARFADAALDGHDRVLSAYCLRDDTTPLARALVIDAAARARTLTPGGAVAPRRPTGLPALAIGAIVLAVAAVAPVRSRASRAPSPPQPAPGVPLAANLLDVERDEARRAAADARALHDEELAALAEELDGTLRRLAAGKLSDGDALEKLSALQRRAAEAAEHAARDARALAAAQKALADEVATRGASEALSVEDGDAGARAQAALGTAAADNPKETARALAAAARGVGSAIGQPGENDGHGDGQRRLSREAEPPRAGNDANRENGRSDERRLERLQRNLEDTARGCREGDPNCRQHAEKRGEDLGKMAGRGASAESLRRLERALRQMRERVGRGEMRGGDQSGMRGFERAARGESGQPGQGQGQSGQGQGDGQQGDGVGTSPGQGQGRGQGDAVAEGKGEGKGNGQGQHGKPGQGDGTGQASEGAGEGEGNGTGEAAAMLGERDGQEAGATQAPGGGVGNGSGGPPLGQRGDMRARGRETEARVASGVGPNRAEVIGGAADRGFAQPGYGRVFADYQAAVEEALAATAVPEGRRYVVRRYFDLIRPRGSRSGKVKR